MITIVARKRMNDIIERRTPAGKFMTFDGKTKKFIGCDNSDGDAWTEEFETLEKCVKWLNDEGDEI